jgi:methylated-DNA-[protein]-cysteine S-methyltransferase
MGHGTLLSTGRTTEVYHRRPTVSGSVRGGGQNVKVSKLGWASIEIPVGQVSVGCSAAGVARVRFGPPPAGGEPGPAEVPGGLLSAARDQLSGYFGRTRRVFDLPLDWGTAAPQRREVLCLLAESVRYGETITYGSLARRGGRPEIDARAVGSIMASNPIPVIVPCHRVVAADGLGGFSGGSGPELKRWLLTFEGALPAMLDFGEPAA